jgi:16S rRNA (cytosine1407-C5)-methyltransferase
MPPMSHPFDRYAELTDLAALKAISERPLRKSVRVHTPKMSVEEFVGRAEARQWQLQGVPWVKEAFFLDRENREKAIGRDPLHLFGNFYMQEAASMLPPELLQPQPGETILDMSAAPGSKTTQMGAKMQGRGVIIANDVQENRLWTLKSAIYRLGVTNVIVTKKVGQWFGKHMTERFNRVLCDAPCTAEGTSRKDSDALLYCSPENVQKMSRLQFQLLEASVHACKVGGRIVYSTCTLTPEENEGIILSILERFPDQLRVVNPEDLAIAPKGFWDPAFADSAKVQAILGRTENPLPLIRLWPQTYDTEGFFSAVLEKTAPTRDAEKMDMLPFQEDELPKARQRDIAVWLENEYGPGLLEDHEQLFQRSEEILLSTQDVAAFKLPMTDYSLGIPLGKKLSDNRLLLHNEFISLRGRRAVTKVLDVSAEDLTKLLQGQDLTCEVELRGHIMIRSDGIAVGHCLAKEGRLKNNLPRWILQHS